MDKNYDKLFGQNIRKMRRAVGMTQEQLAVKLQLAGCDITRSALAKIEVGQRHIYPDEIKLLKIVMKLDYDDFFI